MTCFPENQRFTIMKNVQTPISITTGFFLFFIFLCGFDTDLGIILSLFFIVNICLIWMVYQVIRYGEPSPYTFDKRFYDDADKKTIADTAEDNQVVL